MEDQAPVVDPVAVEEVSSPEAQLVDQLLLQDLLPQDKLHLQHQRHKPVECSVEVVASVV